MSRSSNLATRCSAPVCVTRTLRGVNVWVCQEAFAEYVFAGTTILTDWRVGGPILFQGEAQGRPYQDKGHVLAVEPGTLLQYDFWTGFSGLEDRPENYSVITYTLQSHTTLTLLTLTRVGFANERDYVQRRLVRRLERLGFAVTLKALPATS
jgi:hypothetical protein